MAMQEDEIFDPEVHHSVVRKIPNKSTRTKAKASLPDILYLKEAYGKIAVFSGGLLPKATQFGPLEAPLATKKQINKQRFLMKLNTKKCHQLKTPSPSCHYVYYDTTDEHLCNWMMFVQPASVLHEQNLCAHQNEDLVYFTTTKEIQPHEELKVWYAPTYAKFMGCGILSTTQDNVTAPKSNHSRRNPERIGNPSRSMQVYPNSLVLERDVRSIPPKKRGWKRTKRIDADSQSALPINSSVCCAPDTTESRTCKICNKVFKNRGKLRIHSVIHSTARDFLCHHCGATFKRKDKLRDHEKRVHESKPLRPTKPPSNWEKFEYKCEECELGFRRRGMLISHIMKRHPGKDMSTVEQLSRPLLKVMRRFQCPYCKKAYKSTTKRKLHVMKHHPEKPLPLGLQCKNSNNILLQDATIIAETSIPTNPFKCPYCTMEYSMKHKMDKHIREKHSEYYQGDVARKTRQRRYSSGIVEENTNSTLLQDGNTSQQNAVASETNHHDNAITTSHLFQSTASNHYSGIVSSTNDLQPNVQGCSVSGISNLNMSVSVPQCMQKAMHDDVRHDRSSEDIIFDGLIQDTLPIQAGFDVTRALETDANRSSHNSLFINDGTVVPPIRDHIPGSDFLNQNIRALDNDHATGASLQQPQHYNDGRRTETRYHCGRKRILRYYEDHQNQSTQSQINAELQYSQAGNLSRNSGLHNMAPDGVAWVPCNQTAVGITKSGATNNARMYIPCSNDRTPHCELRPTASLDNIIVNTDQRVNNIHTDWNDNDVNELMNERNFLFDSETEVVKVVTDVSDVVEVL